MFTGNFAWGNEIRNPKKLVYKTKRSGTYEYEPDIACAEITGDENAVPFTSGTTYALETVVSYNIDGETKYFLSQIADNSNTPVIDEDEELNTDDKPDFKNKTGCGWINCTTSVKVKNSINQMSDYTGNLQTMLDNGSTDDEMRAQIEEYYHVEYMIDYIIEVELTENPDVYNNNTQWNTWDGKRWSATHYDEDRTFGQYGSDFRTDLSSTAKSLEMGFGWIVKYYTEDVTDSEGNVRIKGIKTRYNELKEAGVLTYENIFGLFR